MCDELENNFDDESYEAPEISWEWQPGDVGEFGDGILVVTASGNGFVMLEAGGLCRTGEYEARANIKAHYGQTITAEAYIARAGEPVSPITKVTIVVPDKDQPSEPTPPAPEISWEWQPGDLGEFGDGILVVTASGNGFVMLEAGGLCRTGEDEARANIKAHYGQTITAEAYIARAGEPVSPITKVTIVVPGKDQPSEPTPPTPQPS